MNPDVLRHKAIKVPMFRKWSTIKDDRVLHRVLTNKITDINNYVNENIKYVIENKDHWQSPRFTLDFKTGDCEDFAILKRALLLNSGFLDDDIFLLIVKDIISGSQHALLMINESNEILFLDNQNNLIFKEDQIKDYIPMFAFSNNTAWMYPS